MILKKHLTSIGFSDCVAAEKLTQYEQLIAQNNTFYQRVVENQADKSASYLLLGLFTKLHIESIQTLNTHLESIRAMKSAIKNGVGDEHANKFELTGSNHLAMITQAWLYIQGYRGMDFSLANDHALESAELLSKIELTEVDDIRVSLVKYYYLGQEAQPKSHDSSLWSKLIGMIKQGF
ncbi:hypothetical protein [Vibrio maerlii]|uniref:hypothetical protein n=1 Tax=Vibrio maerlii TaxID=2231648 RepID=UPI0013DFD29E|nr:hypothetical protein [Vibrio maerlii]